MNESVQVFSQLNIATLVTERTRAADHRMNLHYFESTREEQRRVWITDRVGIYVLYLIRSTILIRLLINYLHTWESRIRT